MDALVYVLVLLWIAVLACVLLALLQLDHGLIDRVNEFLAALLPEAGGRP